MPKSTLNYVQLLIISLFCVFGILECQETKDKLRDNISHLGVNGTAHKHVKSEKCGGDLEGSSGTINYYFENGTVYPTLISCSWSIKVPLGLVVIFTFIKFETERGYDYLYIGENGNVLLEASGGLKPDQVISSTDKVNVKFTSDWVFSFSGFILNWTTQDSPSSHLMAQCPPVLPTVTCPPTPAPVTCPPPVTQQCPPPSIICPTCAPTKTCPPPPPTPTCPPPHDHAQGRFELPAPDSRSENVLGSREDFTKVIEEPCLDPWVLLENTGECILNSTDILTANSADATCKRLGARLILPRNLLELLKFMKQSELIGDYYVGASDKGSPGHYHWQNGTSLPNEEFWNDFPKDGEPGNSCVVINYYYGYEGLVASRDTNCDKDKWRYICQK